MTSRSLMRRTYTLISAALIVGGFAGSALAESPCKGLEQGQCEAKSGCTWVDGYVRKDGVKVSAHCKSSGKSSGTSSAEEKSSAKAKE
jgi:hypothetical protein